MGAGIGGRAVGTRVGAPINFGFTDTKITASNGFTFGKKDGTYSGSYSSGTGGGSAGGGSGGGTGGGNDAIASEEQK